jgi:hypothetical protein
MTGKKKSRRAMSPPLEGEKEYAPIFMQSETKGILIGSVDQMHQVFSLES